MIQVAIDTGEGLIPRIRWLTFYNYVFFAPVSVAGPIQRYQDFEASLDDPADIGRDAFLDGIQRIVHGIAKKVLIAVPLTPYVLGNMEPCGNHPALVLLASCALYSVYIYADFSGLTDIAIGGARLFGIRVPENFNRPYLATDLQDFWNRWHMTLTQWLRTYLFYPFLKMLTYRFPSHAKRLCPIAALLVTFAVAGLWHGNSWNFLVFGLMHGVGIAFSFVFRRPGPPEKRRSPWGVWVSRLLTFAYVSAAWIPFVYPLNELPWLISVACR